MVLSAVTTTCAVSHYLVGIRRTARRGTNLVGPATEGLMQRRKLLAALAAAPLIGSLPARAAGAFVETRDGQR